MYLLPIATLSPGARLADTVYGPNGQPLLHKGVTLDQRYLEDLKAFGIRAVYIEDPDTSDIEVPHPISPETRAQAVHHLNSMFDNLGGDYGNIRVASVAEIKAHIRSERFSAMTRGRGSAAITAVSNDVDRILEQLVNREVLVGLNSIKSHDAYTYQHSIDVTIMGVILAKRLGWDRHRIKAFAMGCMLHDMGKIIVDPQILNKAGRPTDAEFERIKAHPEVGHDLIRAMAPGLGCLIPLVALQHHEKQDGSGYPRRLRGNKLLGVNAPHRIHDFGAVAAIADIYDAMSSDRPYRAAWSADRVINMIRSLANTHLHPLIVEVFRKTVSPFPVCTRVRVLTGRYSGWSGTVVKVHRNKLDRPIVRLLANPAGKRCNPVEIDLREEADATIESDQQTTLESRLKSSALIKQTA